MKRKPAAEGPGALKAKLGEGVAAVAEASQTQEQKHIALLQSQLAEMQAQLRHLGGKPSGPVVPVQGSENTLLAKIGRTEKVIGSFPLDADPAHIQAAMIDVINKAKHEGRDHTAIKFRVTRDQQESA